MLPPVSRLYVLCQFSEMPMSMSLPVLPSIKGLGLMSDSRNAHCRIHPAKKVLKILIVTKDGTIYDLGGGILPWHMCTLITNQFINAVTAGGTFISTIW